MPVQDTYSGNASDVDFTITFPYTSRGFVEVKVDGVLQVNGTDYNFTSDTVVRFTTAPPSGTDNVTLTRVTSTTLLVDFTAGASILDTDIDLVNDQLAHIAEERASEAYVNAQIAAATLDLTTTVSPFAATVLDDLTADAALSTYGFSAKARTLIALATNATWLTELGITSGDLQTFLASANLATARTNLGIVEDIPTPGLLPNSDFQVWQWGETFNAATPYTGGNNDDVYFADQWKLWSNGNDIVDITKGTTGSDIPDGASGSAILAMQASNTKWMVGTVLENRKTLPLRSKNVSVSVDVKAPNNLTQFKLLLLEWTGTADAPTSDPVSAWNALQVRPTWVTNWVDVGELDITADGTWQTFTLENVAVPSSANNLGVFLVSNDAAWGVSAQVFISKVKLEVGAYATPYLTRSFPEELLDCQRFYTKTFDVETYPVQNIGSDIGGLWAYGFTSGATRALHTHWQFPVPMVAVPTVTTYNPRAADTGWRNADVVGGSDTRAIGVVTPDKFGATIGSTSSVSTQLEEYHIHATADARFF